MLHHHCSTIIWVILWKNSDLLHWAAYINPLFRIFDYLLGMIAGYIYSAGKCKNDEKSKNQPGITLSISLVSISLAIVVTVFSCFIDSNNPWFLTIIWSPLSIVAVCTFNNTRIIPIGFRKILYENRVLVSIGNISFELFLIHQLVIRYWTRLVNAESYRVVSFIICLSISIIVATIWQRVFSKILNSKRKLYETKNY